MLDYLKKSFFINLFVIIVIFSLDRVTKILVINSTNLNDGVIHQLNSFINLNLIWNSGIAFGLFSFDEKNYYDLLTVIIILITAIIAWMMSVTKGFEKIGFTMIFSGSLGNVFDRIYYASVPDFIDVHFNNFHWFIFNVADIFITLGISILIYREIFLKKTL